MRVKPFLEAAGKLARFFWHETFGHHDPRVTSLRFVRGHRVLSMECPCGAEWSDLRMPDGGLELEP